MTHGAAAGSLSVASGPGMMAMLLRLALCVGTGRVASEPIPPVSAASSWPLQHGAATGRPLRLAAAQGMVADSATGQLIDVRTLGAKDSN